MAELNLSPKQPSGKIKRKRMATRVDLTAMVDLAFLLITFFILTTTLAKPRVLQLVMPSREPVNEPWPESKTMTVCLGKENKVLYYVGLPERPSVGPLICGFGKHGIRSALLGLKSRMAARDGKDLVVIIKPSDHSVYENLVNLLDEMSITGTERFAVADISPKDVQLLTQKGAY